MQDLKPEVSIDKHPGYDVYRVKYTYFIDPMELTTTSGRMLAVKAASEKFTRLLIPLIQAILIR